MKNNNSKSLIIIALIVAVVTVSLGFAAYSNSLTIRATADGPFDVDFGTSSLYYSTVD